MTEFSFRCPCPPSLKNRQRIIRRNGRPAILKSQDAADAQNAIATLVVAEPRKRKLPAPIFGSDDVAVEILHLVATNEIVVRVESRGPARKIQGRTGRRRDLSNMSEVPLDAMQGLVFENDNQVAELLMRRIVDQENAF